MKNSIKKCAPGICCPPVSSHCSNAVYGFGFIGAAIYFISTSTGFWNGVLGILKAIVWPAYLVFYLLKSLGL